jgi:hypothetical protein
MYSAAFISENITKQVDFWKNQVETGTPHPYKPKPKSDQELAWLEYGMHELAKDIDYYWMLKQRDIEDNCVTNCPSEKQLSRLLETSKLLYTKEKTLSRSEMWSYDH